MVRFFVSSAELRQDSILLSNENAAHAKVLRLKDGDKVVLCDGNGREAVCDISVAAQSFRVFPGEIYGSKTEAQVRVSVYMALPKADKLEYVIQKATELGAYEIVTFPSLRCVSRPDDKSLKKKLERWQKIAASAAEQCGRGRIPQVVVLGSYKEALGRAALADLPIVFYENEHSNTLHESLQKIDFKSVSILTGPEGGLEEDEIKQAQEAGFKICTLGSRILRCETAPLCALSAIMYHAGEF